jgi:BASS family bile acid:Na+ symporter
MELLQKIALVAMLAFVLSSMLAMGLALTVRQIIAPLRNVRLVVLSLLANFVLMPLGAVALVALLRLDQPLGVGLLLLGAAAGAPFLPKLAQLAKGNLAFAVGLMVLLMVSTVGYLPLVLPVLLPGVAVNSAQIARSLCLLMLLPLAGALAIHAKFPETAARAQPPGAWHGHGATEHCRRARRREPKFQRPESRRHGGRRRARRLADFHAAVAAAGQARSCT